jgi:hypothetical protein
MCFGGLPSLDEQLRGDAINCVQAAHEKWRRVVGRLTSWGVSVISPAFVHYLYRFSCHILHLWSQPSRSTPLITTSTSSETSILNVLYTTAPEVFNVPGSLLFSHMPLNVAIHGCYHSPDRCRILSIVPSRRGAHPVPTI